MSKRTLDSFFSPPPKKPKHELGFSSLTKEISPPLMNEEATNSVPDHDQQSLLRATSHPTYPWPIANMSLDLTEALEDLLGTAQSKPVDNQPHLDMLYFQPLIPLPTARELFKFLRSSLPFYRVCYTINRFGKSTHISTPRFTTVFGLDETSQFSCSTTTSASEVNVEQLVTRIVEASNPSKLVSPSKYKCTPRPIPPCLALLKNLTEALTNDTYNFMLVNYYASGSDSISYHSDDESFLGSNPSIASYTLGARRDFLMKHKPAAAGQPELDTTPVKFSLGSGDMLLMRGETQPNWLHSIPKRKGGEADKGRINITLRKAMIPAGTENYYRYNVGDGEVYRWDSKKNAMAVTKI